jgi:hypothetical protein
MELPWAFIQIHEVSIVLPLNQCFIGRVLQNIIVVEEGTIKDRAEKYLLHLRSQLLILCPPHAQQVNSSQIVLLLIHCLLAGAFRQ